MTHVIPIEFFTYHKLTKTFSTEASDMAASGYEPAANPEGYFIDILNKKTGIGRRFWHRGEDDKVRDAEGELMYEIFRGNDGIIVKVFND